MSLLAAEMRQNDKIACILEERERRERRDLCKAINDFQQNFQKPETCREFDLSDPLALKKDLPARQSDNDARNTVSGMQKFMGEDLNFRERKKFQQEQNREWSLQQQSEWKNAREEQKRAGNKAKKTNWSLYFLQQTTPSFFLVSFCLLSPTNVLLWSCGARGIRACSPGFKHPQPHICCAGNVF